MRKNLVKDERAIAQKRKISSDTCNILIGMLLISILVKEYVLNVSPSQYATELLCVFVAGTYIVIRNIIIGNDLYGRKYNNKNILKDSIISGCTISITIGIINYVEYGKIGVDKLFLPIIFVCWTFAAFLGLSFVHMLNIRSQKKIEENLDSEENEL